MEGFAEQVSAYLPLSRASFHILLALADGEKHGYGIMQEIKQISEDTLRIGPGTLYSTLKKLTTSGLIEETSPPLENEQLNSSRRRYYRLSNLGRTVISTEARRLEQLVLIARQRELLELPAFSL